MPRRKRKPDSYPDVTTAIKAAITEALEGGESFLGIEQKSGVARQSMMYLMSGERTLRMDIADKLLRHFGMTVSPPRRKGR